MHHRSFHQLRSATPPACAACCLRLQLSLQVKLLIYTRSTRCGEPSSSRPLEHISDRTFKTGTFNRSDTHPHGGYGGGIGVPPCNAILSTPEEKRGEMMESTVSPPPWEKPQNYGDILFGDCARCAPWIFGHNAAREKNILTSTRSPKKGSTYGSKWFHQSNSKSYRVFHIHPWKSRYSFPSFSGVGMTPLS